MWLDILLKTDVATCFKQTVAEHWTTNLGQPFSIVYE